jgi:hypothetical protein
MARLTLAVLAGIITTLSGCSLEHDSGQKTGDDAVDVSRAQSPGSHTGLSPFCFWHDSTQVTLRVYGGQSLLDESGLLRPPHFLPDGCAEVPAYMIRCALPEGERIEMASGEVLEGRFGLAPGWLDARLTADEQPLLTACLLQHLGGEVEASFSLEGQHDALADAPSSASRPESILGGNLFMGGTTPVGEAAFAAVACVDAGLDAACGGAAEDALRARICGKAAVCGLEIVGACQDACDFDDEGRVAGCGGDLTNGALRAWIDTEALSSLHARTCE